MSDVILESICNDGLSNKICKGGRGNKATYETTHCRVPVELKEVVNRLSDEYKLTGNVPTVKRVNIFNPTPMTEPVVDTTPSECTLTKEEAIALANSILKSKKGAKAALEKLLTSLYSPPVTLD